jgi:phosphonate metabolism-associated iron-containing alcohol dehydrogenase
MSNWRYHNPVEIHFGLGIINALPDFVASHKAVLITTPGFTKRGVSDSLKKLLGDSLVAIFDDVHPNPTFHSIRKTFMNLQPFDYDLIIALGGGSAIDTAKAVAAIKSSAIENWIDDHLKCGAPFSEPFNPKPVIAIPTTAGTGSEVTMWATIWDMEEKKKYSISHPSLYPEKAILDPELTLTLPEKETIYSGLDAFSHAMEAIWNKNHNPVSDTLALKAISLVHDYLPELRNDLSNVDLRTRLLQASLFAGLAFSNTKTALAHSISYPLTAHFGLPHGLACSLPLPHILRFNGKRSPKRVTVMAEALGSDISVQSMASEIIRLFERLGVSPHLADYGIDSGNSELILKSAFTSGRADNNIVEIDHQDLVSLIEFLF